jgi:hypothetical protein
MVIQNGEETIEDIVVSPTEFEVDAKEQVDGDENEFVETCRKKVADRLLPRRLHGSEVGEDDPLSLKDLRGFPWARAERRLERFDLVSGGGSGRVRRRRRSVDHGEDR